MIPMTLTELARATSGRLGASTDGAVTVTGPVVIDSRAVEPGALFVALPGERVDGHDFAPAALAAGAAAVLAARDVAGPCVVVEDVQLALGALARAVRDRLSGLAVVAVTGSSGKTSTKDLLAQVLAGAGETVAPVNSFNNEIGVPLTLLRCTATTRYLISEMGARMPGNISYLCDLTRPTVGVVLNVGAAHAGVFGSRQATAATKGELVEALPSAADGGVAVLNADDANVAAMADRTAARVVRFSAQGRPDAPVRARDVRLDDAARATFTLCLHGSGPGAAGAEDGDEVEVALQVHGAHHVANALAVAAVAHVLGLPAPRIAQLLSTATATSSGRMSVHRLDGGPTIIDDAYNANPDSMAAALAALVAMRPAGGRAWAVLGEMLELGPDAADDHRRITALAAELGVDQVVAVGEGGALYGTAPHLLSVPDLEAARDLLTRRLGPRDVVLVKASRAIGLDALARALRESPEIAGLPPSGVAAGQDVRGARGLDGSGPRAGGPSRHEAGEVGA